MYLSVRLSVPSSLYTYTYVELRVKIYGAQILVLIFGYVDHEFKLY